MSRTREKNPKSQYPLFVQDKDMAQGSSIAGHAFCDAPTNGISDKDLAFLMHKAISISSFSLSNGDPNQALNEKHQLYFLHFKPTGQTVGSLFEKCITRNKKIEFCSKTICFFGVFLGTNLPTRWGVLSAALQSQALGVYSTFSIKKHGRFTSRLLCLVLAPELHSLRVNMGWNCQDLKAGS